MTRTPSEDVDSSAFQVASISVVENGAARPATRHPSMNPPSKVLFSSFINRCSSRSFALSILTSPSLRDVHFLFNVAGAGRNYSTTFACNLQVFRNLSAAGRRLPPRLSWKKIPRSWNGLQTSWSRHSTRETKYSARSRPERTPLARRRQFLITKVPGTREYMNFHPPTGVYIVRVRNITCSWMPRFRPPHFRSGALFIYSQSR
jgi:hypothetical protein